MATDVEESDTDDHERPAPPKRQCTRLVNGTETYDNPDRRSQQSAERSKTSGERDYDDVKELARERLSRWQMRQVAKGFLDNTINCAMENCILDMPSTNLGELPLLRLFRGNDMEDTAVAMAIRNHGLVNSTNAIYETRSLPVDGIFEDDGIFESTDIFGGRASMGLPNSNESTATSSSLPGSSRARDVPGSAEIDDRVSASWPEDEKIDDSDREQDFLERAVAEAIKKKGLSVLSVDYG